MRGCPKFYIQAFERRVSDRDSGPKFYIRLLNVEFLTGTGSA
jgi:hypothetical protein